MDTVVQATKEYLESQMILKQEEITRLLEANDYLAKQKNHNAMECNRMREAMQEWTFNAIEQALITHSEAEEIADICGFDLTKEVEVTVTVEYTMTLNVGVDEDAESIVHDIDFDSVQYNEEQVSWLNAEIQHISI